MTGRSAGDDLVGAVMAMDAEGFVSMVKGSGRAGSAVAGLMAGIRFDAGLPLSHGGMREGDVEALAAVLSNQGVPDGVFLAYMSEALSRRESRVMKALAWMAPARRLGMAMDVFSEMEGADRRMAESLVEAGRFALLSTGGGLSIPQDIRREALSSRAEKFIGRAVMGRWEGLGDPGPEEFFQGGMVPPCVMTWPMFKRVLDSESEWIGRDKGPEMDGVAAWMDALSASGEGPSGSAAMTAVFVFLETGRDDLAAMAALSMGRGDGGALSDRSWMDGGGAFFHFHSVDDSPATYSGPVAGPVELAAAMGRMDFLVRLLSMGFSIDQGRMRGVSEFLDSRSPPGAGACAGAMARAEEAVLSMSTAGASVAPRPRGI